MEVKLPYTIECGVCNSEIDLERQPDERDVETEDYKWFCECDKGVVRLPLQTIVLIQNLESKEVNA